LLTPLFADYFVSLMPPIYFHYFIDISLLLPPLISLSFHFAIYFIIFAAISFSLSIIMLSLTSFFAVDSSSLFSLLSLFIFHCFHFHYMLALFSSFLSYSSSSSFSFSFIFVSFH